MDKSQCKRSKSVNSDELITVSGYLLKKSQGFLKKFRRVYVTLENKHLSIHSGSDRLTIKAHVDFDQITTISTLCPNDPKKLQISFKGSQKIFIFKGKEEEMSIWHTNISIHISQSLGSRTVLTNFLPSERFWMRYYLSESKFAENAETGDVVFFRGKNTMCSAIRGILNCEFDHIAVVYILNDYIYLFESSRSTGVSLLSWSDFIDRHWFDLYQRVGYRKLKIERNKLFYDKAYEFVTTNEGKPYKLLKLSNNNSTGYFCSELVAEFYKETGVIYQNIPSKKFMPKDFINSNALNIIQGELGPLQDIQFERPNNKSI